MATLTEKIDSRETVTGERPSVTMHYILDGTSDDITAKTLLLNSTPTSYDGLVRDECTLEPIFVDDHRCGQVGLRRSVRRPGIPAAGGGRVELQLRHRWRHTAHQLIAGDRRQLRCVGGRPGLPGRNRGHA